MLEIEKLLIEVSAIRQRYEHLAKVTGENFNIFRILGLQTSEVRLHSTFLAELLNPKGSHGQGELFLLLFLNQENIKRVIEQSNVHLELKSIEVIVEYHTGRISDDGEQGGRIDILFEDVNKQHIIIENKIYASDQPKQLIRYNNFDPKAALFYLNLSGEVSSDFEKTTAKGLTKGINYEIISYQDDILKWLEACMKEASTLPFIRETIHQYINLIKRLTGQSINNKMKDDIIQLFKNNGDYLEVAQEIANALVLFEKEVRGLFFTLLKGKADKNIRLWDGNILFLTSGEDGDGIYFGFCLKNDKQERINKSEIGEKYSSILKGIYPQMFYNEWNIGWFNPAPIVRRQKFNDLDRKQRFEMFTNYETLEKFVDDLIKQRDAILQKFIEEIEK